MRGNEIFELLGAIFDKLERIEKHLGIEESSTDADGGVKFQVVKNEDEKVVEFPARD
jgi:hypothetical protein